jgi:hypothetical protein
MPAKKYVVRLTQEERRFLKNLVTKGKAAAYKIRHANILLKADVNGPCWKDDRISEAFGCHRTTVEEIRKRLVRQGLDFALDRKKREMPPVERIFDGEKEANLIALSRSKVPSGHAKWSLRLLAEKAVELNIVESVSYRTIGRVLKKIDSSLT